jgi:integrase|tara:strand:- start:1789 stop:2700 length:912 start_codon:yes stop_codon:yes gene_type:complete
VKDLKRSSPLTLAVEHYRKSPKFRSLAIKTQKDYVDQQTKICDTVVQNNVKLGDITIGRLSLKHISNAYEQWLQVGTRTANMRISALSVVIKYAMQNEVIDKNATLGVSRKKDATRNVLWSKSDIKKFLDVAYGDFNYRSIALICHMAYDFGQRIGDMRLLKWDSISFDENRLDIKQSKRGAEVHLPISDTLIKMLQQQKDDFGFQDYVCPRPNPGRGKTYTPYSMQEISYLVSDIKKQANLCASLYAMDLRRTAITEMVEAGVDLAGVMQVSGHQNPQSVKPYLVNTFSGASQALAKRNENN